MYIFFLTSRDRMILRNNFSTINLIYRNINYLQSKDWHALIIFLSFSVPRLQRRQLLSLPSRKATSTGTRGRWIFSRSLPSRGCLRLHLILALGSTQSSISRELVEFWARGMCRVRVYVNRNNYITAKTAGYKLQTLLCLKFWQSSINWHERFHHSCWSVVDLVVLCICLYVWVCVCVCPGPS